MCLIKMPSKRKRPNIGTNAINVCVVYTLDYLEESKLLFRTANG